MKLTLLFLGLGILLSFSEARAQANHIVISEIYGGGGNSGAVYKNDFVELYNPTSTDVVMTSWSIQYSSATGTSWATNKFTFSGTIKAKSFFLIQLANNGASSQGVDLPTADVANASPNLSATAGKLALCNSTTGLSAVINPADANIVDKVGYGATATGFEGAPASAPSNSSSLERKASSTSTSSSMTVGGSDVALGNGYDLDNNSTDFVIQTSIAINPQSSASAPEGGVTNSPSVTFSPSPLAFGNQLINSTSSAMSYELSYANLNGSDLVLTTASPYSISETESGAYANTVTLTASELSGSSTLVYVKFSPTSSGIANGSVIHSGAGLASQVSLNISGTGLDPNQTTFNFSGCSSTLSDGFTQYSVTGAQVWACTNFGHDPADATNKLSLMYGVQINGFANSTNNTNEDWLISPALNISSFTYPLLSFWSRNKFAGSQMKLKVSTNYSGSGSPYAAGVTWSDLDGKFPATNTDIWMLSENIDLSNYRSPSAYIAFIYNSSTDDGARWTLDDITVTNSSVAPPAQLASNPSSVDFGYQLENTISPSQSFSLVSSNLTDDVTLAASPNFSLSLDNVTFSSNLVLDKTSYTNTTTTVYIKFSPTASKKTYVGNITVTSPGASILGISLTGSTISTANTLEVVNWNIEWFAGTNGPSDDVKQKTNVIKVMKSLNADIYALGEIVNVAALADVTSQIGFNADEYGYYVSQYGSYAQNPADPDYGNAQKLAFIYRKSVVNPIETPQGVLYTSNEADPVFNYWSSGRFPFQLKANITLDGISKQVNFIMVHAKAETSAGSYLRRVNAISSLKTYLDANEASSNFIILGDYNDDLDFTISELSEAGGTTNSSYKIITDDPAAYKPLTLPLSLAGKKSTTGYNDVIDHVVTSNEMYSYYLPSSAQIVTSVESVVSPDSYSSTTSDHYPVLTRYAFDPIVLPVANSSFSAVRENGVIKLSWKTASAKQLKHFEVERSTDGRSFNTIETITYQGLDSYSSADNAPVWGNNYYRLKEVDLSNAFTYSDIKKVSYSGSGSVAIFPNPFSSVITISAPFDGADMNLTISSVSGQKLYSLNGNLSSLNNALKGLGETLNSGVYLFSLKKDSQIHTIRVLKK